VSESDNSVETLWAPWRIEYILQDKPDDCIFCTKAPMEVDDRKELVLSRGKHSFAIMNLYPYNNGHIMVSPYKHTAELSDLDDATHLEMMQSIQQWLEVLKKSMNPQGFNMGANLGKVAGAGVEDHYHMHLVPRWNGDTNFMPVLGHTKVMVESMEETWDRLTTVYQELYGERNKID